MIDALGPPFTLTDGDRRNPLWLKLKEELETRLRNLRGKNDGPLTPDETATIRGQIQSLKQIIALGDEPPIDGN